MQNSCLVLCLVFKQLFLIIILTHPFTEEVFAHCLANDEGEEDKNALEENWIRRLITEDVGSSNKTTYH